MIYRIFVAFVVSVFQGVAFGQVAVPSPVPTKVDVVFIGDSITASWITRDSEFFTPGRVDKGIAGQTTSQILARFQQDVIDLHPSIVHIMAGTNDIAQNEGPVTNDQIAQNIETMATMALRSHIKVIIGSVLPCTDFFWHHGLQPAPTIKALNVLLKNYAQTHGLVFADYYTEMDDGSGGLRADLGINVRSDGQIDKVHPSVKGYEVMDPIAEKALRSLEVSVDGGCGTLAKNICVTRASSF
jgi:lysophospholipase L1-like esterase